MPLFINGAKLERAKNMDITVTPSRSPPSSPMEIIAPTSSPIQNMGSLQTPPPSPNECSSTTASPGCREVIIPMKISFQARFKKEVSINQERSKKELIKNGILAKQPKPKKKELRVRPDAKTRKVLKSLGVESTKSQRMLLEEGIIDDCLSPKSQLRVKEFLESKVGSKISKSLREASDRFSSNSQKQVKSPPKSKKRVAQMLKNKTPRKPHRQIICCLT